MLLTWRDNRNAGPLRLDDLLGAFQLCTAAGAESLREEATSRGMGPRFRGHVPQQVPGQGQKEAFFEP